MISEVALAIAATGAAVLAELEPYRTTSHGPNPWSTEGLMSVISMRSTIDKAARLVDGKINSCFRSLDINKAVGGSPTSDHLCVGGTCAVDLKPRAMTPHEAAQVLYEAALQGELENVREVLEEPGCVHIGWAPKAKPVRPRLGKWRM